MDSSGQLSKLTKISFDTHVEGVLELRYNQDGQIYKNIVDGYTFLAPRDGVLQMDFYGDPSIYAKAPGCSTTTSARPPIVAPQKTIITKRLRMYSPASK